MTNYHITTKRCSRCNTTKPLTDFDKHKGNKDGYQYTCKQCRQVSYIKDAERLKAKAKANYKPDKVQQYQQNNADKIKAYRYKSRYGLTLDEVNALLAKGCEICGSFIKLHIDHNHKTKQVRGCLCDRCNRGLGYLGDNINLLLKAAEYLKVKGSYNTR